MIYKLKRLASIATSALMVSSTVAMAAAANFPEPFVKNGVADVAVVYGATGASSDLVAATNIASSLSKSITAQSATGTTITSDFTGDHVQLSRASDNLNMGDTFTVGGTTLDDEDLSTILADGTYSNDENSEYEYTQKIVLGSSASTTLTHFADSDYKNREPTIGFKIASGTLVANYTLDFTTNPQSDVVSGDLDDIESTSLKIMGKEYFIFDADNTTLDLTLLDAASSATVSEGESVSLTTTAGTYDVSISFIGTSEVKLLINGEVTNSLNEKETQKLKDGSYVGVKDISVQDYAGGSKMVEFSIGSGKLFLDNNANVELNDDDIDGIKSYVARGTFTSSKETIDKIVLEWKTDDEFFITPDMDLVMPGFESIKFSMNDFVTSKEETIKIENNGNDEIQLVLPIKDGIATIPILHANSTGELVHIGDDSEDLVTSSTSSLIFNLTTEAATGANANRADGWFVASWNNTNDYESYFLEINSGDIESKTDGNKTSIRNVVTGDVVCKEKGVGDECTIGDVVLTITEVLKSGTERSVNISGASGVSFNRIYTAEGLTVYLPWTSIIGTTNARAIGLLNLTADNDTVGNSPVSYNLFFSEEDKDGNLGYGSAFNVTIDEDSASKIEVSQVNGAGSGGANGKEIGSTDVFETYLNTTMATRIRHTISTSGQDTAEVTYWGDEAYAEVFVSEGAVGSTGSAGGIVPMKDSEASSVTGKNLIVVGGSCVNTVAAQLLGVSASTCGSDWEAKTGVGTGEFLIQTFDRGNGKVATLVAGYNAEDTSNAGSYLTTSTVDTAAGKKYTGTSATSASLVTM
jgi:hypothetical protein